MGVGSDDCAIEVQAESKIQRDEKILYLLVGANGSKPDMSPFNEYADFSYLIQDALHGSTGPQLFRHSSWTYAPVLDQQQKFESHQMLPASKIILPPPTLRS